MSSQNIIDQYNANLNAAKSRAEFFRKKANSYSFMRLGVFALLILAVTIGIIYNTFAVIAIGAIILAVLFVWLVARQSQFERERNYYNDLATVNENEINSISHYGNLYDNGARFADDKHFYTADLDIFGKASLFNLINRSATQPGNTLLAQWLQAPANRPTILQRQAAVNELAMNRQWCLEMQALLLFARNADAQPLNKLTQYLGTPVDMPGEAWLKKYAAFCPLIMLAAILLAIFKPELKAVPVLLGMVHLAIVFSKARFIKMTDLITGKIGGVLASYARVFNKAEEKQWESAMCTELSQQLKTQQTSAQIHRLAVLISRFNSRLNLLVGTLLNIFFLWDIRQIIAIEEWKRENKSKLGAAIDTLANFEALISLSSLRANYEHWAMPVIEEGEGYTLTADEIAHPLIPADRRVANTYALQNTRKIDIITGSNMAGKSTFLRTVGINAVLALSGAPVCAQSLSVSVMHIISYMRIKDSLNESTSTFKAELDRLQMLLAAVDTMPDVFFLIDEMLRGTNSVDKYLGSKAVIEQLIAKRGVGMVATHDLQIARLEDTYTDYVRNYYFDIQVLNGEMLFDYKLKHGECKTFNASMLLRQIGINVGRD